MPLVTLPPPPGPPSAAGLPKPFSSVTAIPTTFFIDRNGIIQDAVVGYHDLAALKQHALGKDYDGTPKPAPGAEPVEKSSP